MCPVCFSGADAVTRETLNAGIGVLLGVTVVVLALFARFFLKLARRSRAAAHLVDHVSGRPQGRPLHGDHAQQIEADLQVGQSASGRGRSSDRPDDRRVA